MDHDAGYRTVWLKVIEQAFIDASSNGVGGNGKSSASWAEKVNAHEWLLEDSRDKRFICMMAGVSPREVKQRYFDFLKSGKRYWDWRGEE